MGLPTNQAKGQGCNPVSSNCVIWQGPDIPCINLCHGDSVTDVVAKLATELCDILDTLDIKTYDIDCFKPICPDPENFHDLIQFLITKVCELQCCCDGTKPSESACPDNCIVTVASCFYFTNQLGDIITTMTLKDYVTAIGNKLCTLIPQIDQNSDRLTDVETEQTAQGNRITTLETEVDAIVTTLPASCLYPANTPIQSGVSAIATELCNLEQSTGSPIEILQSIQKQIPNLDNLRTLANRNTNYGSITGWVQAASYTDLADSINNMWLTINDIRTAVENILLTCCCTDCDDVEIAFYATLTGQVVDLYFTGSVPPGLADCYPSGNFVTITDSAGGSYSVYVPVVTNINGAAVPINLDGSPVNVALDLTITIQGCWNRPAPGSDCGGLRCERILTYTIINTAPCPVLGVVPTYDQIAWSFVNLVANPVSYTIKLYKGASLEQSVVVVDPGVPNPVNGTFMGLDAETSYYIVVEVTVGANPVKVCPQVFVDTLAVPCLAPTAVSASL